MNKKSFCVLPLVFLIVASCNSSQISIVQPQSAPAAPVNNNQPAQQNLSTSSNPTKIATTQPPLPNQTTVSQSTASASGQVSFSQDQIAALAGNKYEDGNLPLGDYKYSTSGPKVGYVYLCRAQTGGGGAQENGSWISGSSWNINKKINVEGSVSWPNADYTMKISGSNRIITTNDLPTDHTTGIFPIQSSDPAHAIDANPNTITAQNFTFTLPVNPILLSSPACMGGEVGVMTDGIVLFNAFDAEGRDAAAHEVQDSCQAHPQESGIYHYHSLSSCIKNATVTNVIGYAFDGIPITGPEVAPGKYLTTENLDECHGLTSQIILDGKTSTTYHYVMTEDFPYSVSCFRAKDTQNGPLGGAGQQVSTSAGQQQGSVGQNPPAGGPPQQAIDACSGKLGGSSCSFTTPQGNNISGTCRTPPNSSLACVPNSPPN